VLFAEVVDDGCCGGQGRIAALALALVPVIRCRPAARYDGVAGLFLLWY
jgi:hypothetical protein